jgi:hypothetical protein
MSSSWTRSLRVVRVGYSWLAAHHNFRQEPYSSSAKRVILLDRARSSKFRDQ